jgi:hypothetical protein
MISFFCSTKDFKNALTLMRAVYKGRRMQFYHDTVEITLTDGYVQLAVPGAVFGFKCKTKGTAKATMALSKLWSVVDSHNMELLMVEFYDEALRFGSFQVKASTVFFKDDKVLRTIRLSNNYTDLELMLLKGEGYTKEELEFNNLTKSIEIAEKNVFVNIRKAYKYLKQYGVNPEDIKKIVMERLNVKLDLDETDMRQLFSSDTRFI